MSMKRVRPTLVGSKEWREPVRVPKRRYLDALIESYEAWLSWQRALYDTVEGESEVIEEIARLRKVQSQSEAA